MIALFEARADPQKIAFKLAPKAMMPKNEAAKWDQEVKARLRKATSGEMTQSEQKTMAPTAPSPPLESSKAGLS